MTSARLTLLLCLLPASALPAQITSPPSSAAVTLTVAGRQRVNATQWFGVTPNAEVYGHMDSLLRLGLQQRIRQFDWQFEIAQNSEFFLPADAVSPIAAQGQLGLGGTYYAANNNSNPTAASFRTGFLRYHFGEAGDALRVGRFEFFDGQETAPKDATLAWLQTNRIAQRLIGNFGFSNGQRSFDGVDAKLAGAHWDLTAMAGRATQGVFNMNANPELNVDIQYLAYTRYLTTKQRVQLRGFALGYHDGRTGLTKTDNRPLALRQADHGNIRIGSYGANLLTALPVGGNTLDLVFWGVLQNGAWGSQDHRAGAVAAEAGLRFNNVATRPWLRGGFLRATGDNTPNDSVHNTFFQVLPTPRIYARFPYFNMMNSSDQFVQVVDKPSRKLEVRTDLYFLQLTAANDLWYQGGGAFDNKVFGYTGRPSNSHNSFSSLYDISADYALTPRVSLSGFYARSFGKSVIAAIYPAERDSQYGYFELNYKFSHSLGGARTQ